VLIDQTPGGRALVPFFAGQHSPRAAGDLAAASVPDCSSLRPSGGADMHRIGEGIDVQRTGIAIAIGGLTAAATRCIEDEVRSRPDEWVWMPLHSQRILQGK